MKVRKETKQYIECDLAIVGATLLSVEEAEELPPSIRIYTSWYWLRSPGYDLDRATNVDCDGTVYSHGRYVSYGIGAVRPALKIKNLESSSLKVGDVFEFGGKEFKIISENLTFCLTDIGEHCFRDEWKSKDANNYEKSDVKKYIDDWFNNATH